MNFTGIDNENDFFPSGAFSDDLADEFASIASGWPKGADDPLRRLKAVADPWLRMVERVLREPRATEAIEARRV